MDADRFIALAEKYLREFILYLVSFFWKRGDGSEEDKVFDDLNRSVVFAVFSAIIGAFLWDRYILGLSGRSADLLGLLADNLLRWMSLGLVLYLLMRATLLKVHILPPILSVLKVFSVAHVVAIYSAYVFINVLSVFARP